MENENNVIWSSLFPDVTTAKKKHIPKQNWHILQFYPQFIKFQLSNYEYYIKGYKVLFTQNVKYPSWLEHKMPGPLGISWSCTHTLTKSKPFNINMYLQNCGISLYVYIDHDDCNCTEHSYE